MRSILVGNGINNQFGGKAYSSNFIMKRIIFNSQAGLYDHLFGGRITGDDIAGIFKSLVNTANAALANEYDDLSDPDEKEALLDFKVRYSSSYPMHKYYEIMLEDWFLVIRLFFATNTDLADQWKSAKQGIEQLILDGIYNKGDIQTLHTKMNRQVKRYFAGFDNIFTLNYDNNLERLTGKNVFHLHGDYSILADSENPVTVMGYLRHNSGELSRMASPIVIVTLCLIIAESLNSDMRMH